MTRPGGRRSLLSPAGLGVGVAMGLGIMLGWPLAWAAGLVVGFVLAALWARRRPGPEPLSAAEPSAEGVDPQTDLGLDADGSIDAQRWLM